MKSRVLLLLASVVVVHAQNRHIKAESSALPKLDCTSPGFYTFGCERVFAHCDENGNSRFFTCRNSLFIFDRYTHRCENIRAVLYCNGAEAQATKTWIRERQLGASSFASHKISGTGYTSNSYSASSSSNSIAAQTGGPLATAAPPIEADVPSPDFDCDGKTDGIYEKEAGVCRTRFWVCSNGAKHEYACPKGLFFQSATQQCDWRRNIVACGGTLPTATSAPAQDAQRTPAPYGAPTTQASYTGNTLNENIGQAQPPAPPPAIDHGSINSYSQQQPQPSIKFSCVSKTDGYYADGPCLNYYVICAAGAAQRLTCPSGLVYNEAKNACDFEDWCRNPPPPTTTNAPVAQAPPAYDTTKCSTLNNGTHASGPCSENYYLCWNGVTSVAMCTKGLVYNDYNGQCDYRDNVISCNLGKAQDQPLPPPVIATTPAAPIKIDTFCSDKADGLYGQQCSSYFYHCQQRATTKMLCPVGLFFNEQSKSCDHNVNILACNPALSAAQPPAPPPRTVVQTVQTSSYNQQNYGQQQQIVAPPPPPPTRPQQQFIQQAPLAANNYQQGSNYQQKTVITTQQRLVASPPAPPPPSPPKQSFDCTGKPNGFYAPTGCQKSFVQCNNGQAFIADCQGNLLWNAEKAQCDYSENILVCNPNAPRVQSVAPPAPPPPPPSSSAQNYNQYTSQTVQQRDALINPPAPSTPQYSCNGVPEGVYEVSPCSPYYAHCHNGFSNVAACIAPLIYNSDNGQCDYRENVPSCNGGRRPPPPPPSNDQPVINSLNGFSCLNQPDSFYASGGCSSTYYACHGGALKAMDCSAGLVFNEQNQLCDYPESVPTCVARSNARSNGNVITRGYKVYQTIGNDQQSNSQIPPSAGSCFNRPDGHYATGCSSTYISCHGGAVDIMTCPGNLFFNESTGACVYPEAVSGCSRGGIQQDSASTSGPSCLNRVDGFYAQGCSSSYIACHGGAVDIMTCPGNLFFNESTGACVHPEQVPGCRGSGSTTVSQTQTVIQQDQSTVTSMNGFSCLSRSDGNYAQGCSSTYFACTSGALRVMECAAGLFFNQDTQFCVYPASVPQCNGAQSPTEFSCVGKAEGVYALGGCNKQYATCHSGTTFISECYGELVFSPLTLRCDYKQQVAGCSGIQPQQAAQSQPLPPAALFNCANLQNGLYSKVPCREWYIHCQNGVMFENTCPGELIFNQQTGQCDFRSNVQECANPGSIAPPAPPPSNNIENDAPATPEPLTAGERTFCANKANGIYSEGCKQRYYVCTAQSTYAFICPRGLVFSQFKQACDFSANVPDCTDYVPPPPAQSPREY